MAKTVSMAPKGGQPGVLRRAGSAIARFFGFGRRSAFAVAPTGKGGAGGKQG